MEEWKLWSQTLNTTFCSVSSIPFLLLNIKVLPTLKVPRHVTLKYMPKNAEKSHIARTNSVL